MTSENKKILLIDDQADIHDDFRKILTFHIKDQNFETEKAKIFSEINGVDENNVTIPAYQIDSAYQGEEALELVKKAHSTNQPYSLAFVDIRMEPGWDGIKTVKHIWAVDPEIQIVICTAHADYSWEKISNVLRLSDNFLILKKTF